MAPFLLAFCLVVGVRGIQSKTKRSLVAGKIRGGSLELVPHKVARKYLGAAVSVYAAGLVLSPGKYNDLDQARNDKETRSQLRSHGLGLLGFPYIFLKGQNLQHVLEACLLVTTGWGIVGGAVRYYQTPQSLAPKIDLMTSLLLALTLTAAINDYIKPGPALTLFAVTTALFGFINLILPTTYIASQDALSDETSKRRTRFLAADMIGMATLAWNALDKSLPLSHVALRSALAFLYIIAPISFYRFIAKKSPIATLDSFLFPIGLLLTLLAKPSVLPAGDSAAV